MKCFQKILLAFVGLFAATVFAISFVGINCIVTTLLFYIALTWVGRKIIAWLLRKRSVLKKNVLLCFTSLTLTTLGAELILRYFVRAELNYCELNNEFFSYDERTVYLKYWGQKFFSNQPFSWLGLKKKSSRWQSNQEFSYKHDYNSIGFRDTEPNTKKAKKIIVALGDSFTEGIGSPQDSTYPCLLDKLLSMPSSYATEYTVLNAGKAGSDVYSEYIILKDYFMQYHPRLVLLLLNSSDIIEVERRGGIERFMPNGKVAVRPLPWWYELYQISYITRIIVNRVMGYNGNLIPPSEAAAKRIDAQMKIVDGIVTYIAPLAKKSNASLIVVYQPVQKDIESSDELAFIKKQLANYKNITTIDLLPTMRADKEAGNINLDSLYWKIDRHFKPEGYAYLASKIYYQLQPFLYDTSSDHKSIMKTKLLN